MVNEEVGPMASTTYNGVLSLYGDRAASVAEAIGGGLRKLGRRVSDALETQRRREVDHEIAHLLGQSGGRLTDSVEREIERTLSASDWRLPD
jgi:acetyl-CoA carboxylase alpha subunit